MRGGVWVTAKGGVDRGVGHGEGKQSNCLPMVILEWWATAVFIAVMKGADDDVFPYPCRRSREEVRAART